MCASKNKIIIPFSHLALGGKFKYIPTVRGHEKIYVKISNDRLGGCIAEWDEENLTTNWVGQGIYSLNNSGGDCNIEVVE